MAWRYVCRLLHHHLLTCCYVSSQHDPGACTAVAALLQSNELRVPAAQRFDEYKLDWVCFALTIRAADFAGLLLTDVVREATTDMAGDGPSSHVAVRGFASTASGERVSESAIMEGDVLYRVGGQAIERIATATNAVGECLGQRVQLHFKRK